ncbi:hypothetical protein LINGRAPRIM_LOCUS1332 [Linum grandiflorum]
MVDSLRKKTTSSAASTSVLEAGGQLLRHSFQEEQTTISRTTGTQG